MRVRARVCAGLCVGARVWVCGGAHVRARAREAAYVSVRVSPRLGALEGAGSRTCACAGVRACVYICKYTC